MGKLPILLCTFRPPLGRDSVASAYNSCAGNAASRLVDLGSTTPYSKTSSRSNIQLRHYTSLLDTMILSTQRKANISLKLTDTLELSAMMEVSPKSSIYRRII